MSNSYDFDVAIIGAGPAGIAAAIALPHNLSIVHLDKNDSAGGKLCSGLLTMEAMESVRKLTGERELPANLRCASSAAILRSVDFDNKLTTMLDVGYTNILRDDFDRWLFSRIERNPHETRFRARVQRIASEYGGFSVDYRLKGVAASVRVRAVIDASGWTGASYDGGRNPRFARRFALQFNLPGACDKRTSEYRAFFLKSATDWFGWTIPKDDGIAVGMGFRRVGFDGRSYYKNGDDDEMSGIGDERELKEQETPKAEANDAAARCNPPSDSVPALFVRFIRELVHTDYIDLQDVPEERDANGTKLFFKKHAVKGCPITALSSVKEVNFGQNRIFVIGEAAGLVSPSSGDGISYALASGVAIGRVFESLFRRNSQGAMLNGSNGEAYRQYRDLLAQELRELRFNVQKAKMLANPKLRNAALHFLTWHKGRRMERL